MAEFLIRALPSYLEDYPPNIRNKWPDWKKDQYDRRIMIGDVITCAPTGHVWGAKEGLPKYVIARVDPMTHAEAHAYCSALVEQTWYYADLDMILQDTVHRKREFQVKPTHVDTIINVWGGFIEIARDDFDTYLDKHVY